MCTINKSAHTKKIWKLIICTSYNIKIDSVDFLFMLILGTELNLNPVRQNWKGNIVAKGSSSKICLAELAVWFWFWFCWFWFICLTAYQPLMGYLMLKLDSFVNVSL